MEPFKSAAHTRETSGFLNGEFSQENQKTFKFAIIRCDLHGREPKTKKKKTSSFRAKFQKATLRRRKLFLS